MVNLTWNVNVRFQTRWRGHKLMFVINDLAVCLFVDIKTRYWTENTISETKEIHVTNT